MLKIANRVRLFLHNQSFGPLTKRNFRIEYPANQPSSTSGLVFKYTAFTITFNAACYSTAAIVNYERNKKAAQKFPPVRSRVSGDSLLDNIVNYWKGRSGVEKITYMIILANAAVFLAWRTNSNAKMLRNFMLFSSSGKCSQMVLSTFSHHTALHFGLNMLALFSISRSLAAFMPPEQFLAFYLSAGVFSSYASNIVKIIQRNPVPSLGASGAIISCVGLVCLLVPHSQFYVMPIPFPVEAHNLFKGLVIFDLVGLVGILKLGFDHAGHLGGSLYAYTFLKAGVPVLKRYQSWVIYNWTRVRSSK